MPFTISHIAIVLPFACRRRKYLSVTGLMTGTMTPDFLYFILLDPYFSAGHTWWGIFLYDVPLALLLTFLYHDVVKAALIQYLPGWAGMRIHHFRYFSWDQYFRQHYLVVISSVILGALSHLLLDAFTHGHGYFAGSIPFLRRNIRIFHHPMEMWYLMQYLSSIAGLLLLIYFFFRIPKSMRPAGKPPRIAPPLFWLLAVLIAAAILWVHSLEPHPLRKNMDYLATVMGAFFYGFCSVVLWLRISKQ
ncbi:DUF4184 family protein [Chitinophaga solisilvae]|uniref:DUF4184 family protein n=1 Tax=Chitinophaga solisilvae TaxID=1233460 RepID=A0A433WGU7_9BACT|nr:DUF4184 family protein [Chitinophaga solisilvae]NSL88778.1 DUF4184 family protein [Chitinophaga solisilvae]